MRAIILAIWLCLLAGSLRAGGNVISVDFAPYVITVPSQWAPETTAKEDRMYVSLFRTAGIHHKEKLGALEFLSVMIRPGPFDFQTAIQEALAQVDVKDFRVAELPVAGFTRVEPLKLSGSRFRSVYFFRQDGTTLCMIELSALDKNFVDRAASVEGMLANVTEKISVTRRVANQQLPLSSSANSVIK